MARPDESFGFHLSFNCGEPTLNESETVYPVKLGGGYDHGMAIAYIDQSPRHYHKIMTETYYVVDGELDIELSGLGESTSEENRAIVTAGPGDTIQIPPGWVHCAKKHREKTVCLIVFTMPPFDPSDYYMSEDQRHIADRAASV